MFYDYVSIIVLQKSKRTAFKIPCAYCDIATYFKKYTCGLHSVSGTELLKPWEFPKR